MRTLETGEGVSTVLFAARGCQHTCVSIDADAVARIKDFCEKRGISLAGVDFEMRPSQEALPALALDPVDVVVVDGGHGFPIPFIDWYYGGSALRQGGLLIIDDIQLWTGDVLVRFLDQDPSWERILLVPRRSAVYRRIAVQDIGVEWTEQPFMVHEAERYARWRRRLEWSTAMVRTGQWDQLANRAGRVAGRVARRVRAARRHL
jgi:hypothetical protein